MTPRWLEALKTLNWRLFTLLLSAGLLGVLAVLPFAFEMLGALPPAERAAARDFPLPLLVALTLLQNGILLSIVIALGLRLSERVGLELPLLGAWAAAQPLPRLAPIVLPGVLVGAAVGAALVALEAALFLRHLPASMLALFEIPLWKRLLAGVVYGGIVEELLMRLFLMSLVAWLLGRWWKSAHGLPAPGAFVAAIVGVAVLFALGHLPATAVMAPLTDLLVARALLLNGLAGIAFGYLYWRHGLEAAMAGHISAHLVLQVPGVMLLRAML